MVGFGRRPSGGLLRHIWGRRKAPALGGGTGGGGRGTFNESAKRVDGDSEGVRDAEQRLSVRELAFVLEPVDRADRDSDLGG
jgi:hypothetical protein